MDTERYWGGDEEDYDYSPSDEEDWDDNKDDDEQLYEDEYQLDDVKMEDDCQQPNVPDVIMLGQPVPGCVHIFVVPSLSPYLSL